MTGKGLTRRVGFTVGGLTIRSDGGKESRTIEGYAIMFGVPSVPLWQDDSGEAREVISPDAVTRSLLDAQDIKMTMFHDPQLILARSNRGAGTLTYDVDERGVKFRFDAPATTDGDKAVELVRRGDINGCSFAFVTRYLDKDCVEKSAQKIGKRTLTTYTVKRIEAVLDFTLTPDPAYRQTSVEARDLERMLRGEEAARKARVRAQVEEMRGESFGKPIIHN